MNEQQKECVTITIEDGTINIKQPFEFGYFPRNKYNDLVFYVRTGENSNCGLIEMIDTEGNRELMEALSRPYPDMSEGRPSPDPTYQELVDFARWTQTFWKNGIEIMRKNNLVIKTGEPMEKLAFTFYSDLCEIDARAAHLFGEGYGDKNHRNESAVVSQTITAYPKPYEERIRAETTAEILGKVIRLFNIERGSEAWEWVESLRSQP